jgi:hypothetical protein
MVAARRRYRLVPAPGAELQDSLATLAVRVEQSRPVEWHERPAAAVVPAPEVFLQHEITQPRPGSVIFEREVMPVASAALDRPSQEGTAPAEHSSVEGHLVDEGATEPVRRPVPAWLELMAAGVPGLACGGLACYLALREHGDILTWTALGAAVGLLLGWSCFRWMRRSTP